MQDFEGARKEASKAELSKKKNAKKNTRFVGLITWKLWLWPKKNRRLSKEIIQFCRCISCQQHEYSESHTAAKAKDNKKK